MTTQARPPSLGLPLVARPLQSVLELGPPYSFSYSVLDFTSRARRSPPYSPYSFLCSSCSRFHIPSKAQPAVLALLAVYSRAGSFSHPEQSAARRTRRTLFCTRLVLDFTSRASRSAVLAVLSSVLVLFSISHPEQGAARRTRPTRRTRRTRRTPQSCSISHPEQSSTRRPLCCSRCCHPQDMNAARRGTTAARSEYTLWTTRTAATETQLVPTEGVSTVAYQRRLRRKEVSQGKAVTRQA